jgi:hypothetical protein
MSSPARPRFLPTRSTLRLRVVHVPRTSRSARRLGPHSAITRPTTRGQTTTPTPSRFSTPSCWPHPRPLRRTRGRQRGALSLAACGRQRDWAKQTTGGQAVVIGASRPASLVVSMKKGLVSSRGGSSGVRVLGRPWGLEQRSCLYGLLGGRIRRNWNVRSRAHVRKGGQAARRKAAPRGANSSFRVSMCQIAWARRRAMSIWATLAPRCLPSRRLLRW